jgi:prepilin-type N-terminal cleavage/methylation domain-containing protein
MRSFQIWGLGLVNPSKCNQDKRLRTRDQKGFFMVEIMIAIAVFSVILLFALDFQERQQATQEGRMMGEELSSVQTAFAQYFNANRAEILTASGASAAANAAVQQHCVVRVGNLNAAINPGTSPGAAGTNGTLMWSGGAGINDGRKTCAFDLSMLQARGFWPPNLPVVRQTADAGGPWRYVSIIRRVRGPGPDGVPGNGDDALTDDAEMLILRMAEDSGLPGLAANTWRNDRSLQQRTINAAREMGPTGGFIPVGAAGACRAVSAAGANNIQACGPGWTVDLAEWIDSAQIAALRATLPAN